MSITVKWANHIFNPDETVVLQRSDTRKGTYNPLVTLDSSIVSYVDTTAADNKVYYYRVASTQDGVTVYSNILPLANFPVTGIGPSNLLRGDWEFGYFGEILNTDFITFAQIVTVTKPVLTTKQAEPTNWFKWIINGKIVFFPSTPLANADAFNYSTSNIGTAYTKPNVDPATNPSIIAMGGKNYMVRLPYITNKFTTTPNPYGEFTAADSNNFVMGLDDTAGISEIAAIGSVFTPQYWFASLDILKYSDKTATGTAVSNRRIMAGNFILDRNGVVNPMVTPYFTTSFYQLNAYPQVVSDGTAGIYYPILELQL